MSIVDVCGPRTVSWQGVAALSTLWLLCLPFHADSNILSVTMFRSTDCHTDKSHVQSVAHNEAFFE